MFRNIIKLSERNKKQIIFMFYFIAIEIKGSPAEFYKTFGDDIYREFGIKPLYHKLPFHITLVPSFTYGEERSEIEKALSRSISIYPRFSLSLSEIGHFDRKTIFLEPEPTEVILPLKRDISSSVVEMLERKDKESFGKENRFHASLVRFIPESFFAPIYSRIEESLPTEGWETGVFDVSLFLKGEHHWETVAKFPLS